MSTPLNATHRFEFSYTVDNESHKARAYCSLVASADPTGWDVVAKPGFSNVGASDAIDAYLTLLAPVFRSTVSAFNPVSIQARVLAIWLPIASYVSAVTPSGSTGAYGPAEQLTLSMRDTDFHKVRQIWFEGLWSGPLKTNAPHGFGGAFNALFDGFVGTPTTPFHDPNVWLQGRSAKYLGSFVSAVVADNDKIRRARGLA